MADSNGLTVSISQLKEFEICPRRYQLHRVLGVEPAFTPVPLALGAATHASIGAMYSSLQDSGQLAPLDAMLQVFRDAWSVAVAGPVAVQIEEDDTSPIDAGVRMVSAFHEYVKAAGPVNVVAVELPFSDVVIHDPDSGEALDEKLSGVIDLVIAADGESKCGPSQSGTVARNIVVEHKTAARKWTRDQLDHDYQVTAYQLAAPQIGLGADVGLRYQIVTKTKTAAVHAEDVVRDDLATVDFQRTASGVLRAIGAGAFWPVRSWACKSCPYAYACSERRG